MSDQTRVAVRIILLDSFSRVLLFEGRDLSDLSDSVRFWFTAGGAVDGDESFTAAAEREVLEETGQSDLGLVGPFHHREFDFLNHGEPQHQIEHYFAARTGVTSLRSNGWTDLEKRVVTKWRWWTTEQLESAGARYFPENLVELIGRADTLV